MRKIATISLIGGGAAVSAIFLATAAPTAELVTTRANAQSNIGTCPTNATQYRGSNRTITCSCSASATTGGSVWGTDVYTDDSRICRAARHAGVIGANGGTVTFSMVGPRSSYTASSRNGVSTSRYGAWRGSYRFSGGRPASGTSASVSACPTNATAYRGTTTSLTCSCSRSAISSGSVWGARRSSSAPRTPCCFHGRATG